MNKLSTIIITKNEENMIADCLESISFSDEIIVVDNGSEDRTVDVAKRLGAKVYIHKTSDFSELRNFGLEKAKGEWVLYVDADERVTHELAQDIKNYCGAGSRFARQISKPVAFRIKRKNFYLGNHEWPKIEALERLFKKSALNEWRGQLHESPVIHGPIGELDGFLNHYTHKSLTEMLKKTIEWSEIEAELRFKANHPKMVWWRFPRVMISAFIDYYIVQKGWKVGTAGLIESIYQSFSIFITYARLWELQNEKGK